MRSMKNVFQSQQGGVMLLAVMVFLMVSMISTAMVGVAQLESKIAINDARDEQARQAADAGIAIGQNILLNYMLADQNLPSTEQVELENGTSVQISFQDLAEAADGVVQIRAEGRAKGIGGAVSINTAVAGIVASGNDVEPGSIVSYQYLDVNF